MSDRFGSVAAPHQFSSPVAAFGGKPDTRHAAQLAAFGQKRPVSRSVPGYRFPQKTGEIDTPGSSVLSSANLRNMDSDTPTNAPPANSEESVDSVNSTFASLAAMIASWTAGYR